jgi:hypothetical protein
LKKTNILVWAKSADSNLTVSFDPPLENFSGDIIVPLEYFPSSVRAGLAECPIIRAFVNRGIKDLAQLSISGAEFVSV